MVGPAVDAGCDGVTDSSCAALAACCPKLEDLKFGISWVETLSTQAGVAPRIRFDRALWKRRRATLQA